MANEIYKVIGRRKVDFETNDGKRILGYNVYTTLPVDGVDGLVAEKFFVSDDKFRASPFKLGDSVRISFNRYGKVDSISPVNT